MKAMVYTKAGGLDVLQLREVERPVPRDDHVLVKVKAAALNIIDYERFKTLSDKVALFPRLINIVQGSVGHPLGGEISGIVVEVGKNITHVKEGDEVFGKTTGMFPKGGWAEYALTGEAHIERKPANFSFEEAAVIPVAFETALGSVRAGKVSAGQQVMVYGSSGGVGQMAVQLSKAAGATVTGVCSTRNIEMAHSIGCDYVVDYKREDFRDSGRTYDVIIGINGNNPLKEYKKLLKKDGVFVGIGGGSQVIAALLLSPFSKHYTTYNAPTMPQKDYLSYAKSLAESNMLNPFIDRIYPVQEAAEAIRYVVTEHAQGKVALSVDFKHIPVCHPSGEAGGV